jgi:transposase
VSYIVCKKNLENHMQLEYFYGQILGVQSPWKVKEVKLSIEEERVDVYVQFNGQGVCPQCEQPANIHDYAVERSWRHLDSCQMKTYLHCRLPRTKCDECKVKTMTPSWSLPNSRFTLMYESFIIKVLLATRCDAATAKILKLSNKEVLGVKNRAVGRGMDKRGELSAPKTLAIDEKSYGNGQQYITTLIDQDD